MKDEMKLLSHKAKSGREVKLLTYSPKEADMGCPLNITEKLQISTEQLVQALAALEKEKFTPLCGRCQWPLRSQTVMLVFESGHLYATEYYCSGKCGNRLLPIPQDAALGKFIERKEI
jgi:hypothetical protein